MGDKLLDDVQDLEAATAALTLMGKAFSEAAKADMAENKVEPARADITEEFFTECSKLLLGELGSTGDFNLLDAMSAIELMDPKMDIGMQQFQKKMGVEVCFEKGVYHMDPPTVLATLDATLCGFTTWLEGHSIAQSLWTNVLLTQPSAVHDMILGPVGHAFAHIVHLVRHTIFLASVIEEEDFNLQLVRTVRSDYSIDEVVNMLAEAETVITSKSQGKGEHLERCMSAVSARLGWIRTFLQAMVLLIPPQTGKDAPSNSLPTGCFVPRLGQGSNALKACHNYARIILNSWHMGAKAPDGVDGTFEWLPAFEPDYNRKHLPPTFPRKAEMMPREKGLPYIAKLTESLLRVPLEVPGIVDDVDKLLNYFKMYADIEISNAFNRSFLQLVIFPTDDRIFGEVPLTEVFIETVKQTIAPSFLTDWSKCCDDEAVQIMWSDLVADCVKVLLSCVQTYGHNIARQRDKITHAMEDMANLQADAEKLDNRCRELQKTNVERAWPIQPMSSFILHYTVGFVVQYFELTFRLELFTPFEFTYVYWYLGEMGYKWIENCLEGFQNMLVFDFKNDPSTSLPKTAVTKADKKKAQLIAKKEEELRSRLAQIHARNILTNAKRALCDATFRVSVGLTLVGKLKIPMWGPESEALRFAHRMLPLAALGAPIHITYMQYKQMSKIDSIAGGGAKQILLDAVDAFEMARVQLEKLQAIPNYAAESAALCKVSKNNVVVARILAAGQKLDCPVYFEFPSDSPIFPVLKFGTSTKKSVETR